ncbi:MAG: hypothetical protein ACRDNP_04915, partial [Gaiellaceae bacterium]
MGGFVTHELRESNRRVDFTVEVREVLVAALEEAECTCGGAPKEGGPPRSLSGVLLPYATGTP